MKKFKTITISTMTALAAIPAMLAIPLLASNQSGSPLSAPGRLIIRLIISPVQAANGQIYHMRVDGMTCPFCVKTSEKALRAIPGVKSVSTNLKKGLITVCASPSAHLEAGKLKKMFAAKGFTFRSISPASSC